MGKEITARTNGTEERRIANLARFGYSFENDPRFNGEHAIRGYEGVGPDPCDPGNNRVWLKNIGVPKPPVRFGRGMRQRS